jgi:hypothetical protein
MKNYKIVGVYSGYSEMSIEGVSEVKGKSLKDVCIDLLKEKKKMFEEDMSYFEEFVNDWGVKGKLGMVGDGEEGFDLIIEEGNEWYEKIDKNDDWSEEEWNEWVSFCGEGIKFEDSGKI